jgi:hypothetical protein
MTCKNCNHNFSWEKEAVRLDVAGIQNRGLCCRLGFNVLTRCFTAVKSFNDNFGWQWWWRNLQNWWNPVAHRTHTIHVAHRAIVVMISLAMFILSGWAIQWAWDATWLCVLTSLQVIGSFLVDIVLTIGQFFLADSYTIDCKQNLTAAVSL